jgi:putative peptide zinc metalloprotease protein
MQEALTSPHWYRVASLHPRLRPHVSVRMQITRGRAWYVLFNQATGRHHRVNAVAYELVGRLDGRRSVDEVWQLLLDRMGDDAPGQSDVIRILAQMTDAGLVQAEITPDVRALLNIQQARKAKATRAQLNPLSFRLGLFNPSSMLERMGPLGRALWSVWLQWPWLLLVLSMGWVALLNLNEVLAWGREFFLTPAYLAMAWVAYPLMKCLHELGHALALRRYGCEVPEVGVNFFLFMPMPYVDASASNRLTNRWQRAHISAAGIWVELGLAALGALVWFNVEDGWVRQAAFVVMSLGGLSSLLFNGNPLMKLDGYYLLCDVLDVPNLAGRSGQAFGRFVSRILAVVLRLPSEPNQTLVSTDTTERWALRLYVPLSWTYRLGISTLIVYWAADKAAWLGLAVLLWSAWTLLIQPVWLWYQSLGGSADLAQARGKALLVVTSAMAALIGALACVPLPASMVAEGVVWLPENAQVRASTDGEVETVWVQSQQKVTQGETLITLKSPGLETDVKVLQAQIERSESEYNAAFGSDPLKMKNAQEALERDRAGLRKLQKDLAGHVLRAGVAGQFVLSRGHDLEAQQVQRGQVLAYVLGPQPTVIRAVLPQRDVDEVRSRLQGVSVMLDEHPGHVMQARWLREVPAAANQLPQAALADRMGGRVPTRAADKQEWHPAEPTYVFDVQLDVALTRAGGLARVRMDLAEQPLWVLLMQRMRQLLLKHFSDTPRA